MNHTDFAYKANALPLSYSHEINSIKKMKFCNTGPIPKRRLINQASRTNSTWRREGEFLLRLNFCRRKNLSRHRLMKFSTENFYSSVRIPTQSIWMLFSLTLFTSFTAERGGFEPPVPFLIHSLSRTAD